MQRGLLFSSGRGRLLPGPASGLRAAGFLQPVPCLWGNVLGRPVLTWPDAEPGTAGTWPAPTDIVSGVLPQAQVTP